MNEIVIDPVDPETMALWRTVSRIARALEGEEVRCVWSGV